MRAVLCLLEQALKKATPQASAGGEVSEMRGNDQRNPPSHAVGQHFMVSLVRPVLKNGYQQMDIGPIGTKNCWEAEEERVGAH